MKSVHFEQQMQIYCPCQSVIHHCLAFVFLVFVKRLFQMEPLMSAVITELIKNNQFGCFVGNFFNRRIFFNLLRLIQPAAQSGVLESDSASARLFTSIPQHQGQSWSSCVQHWSLHPWCRTPSLHLQVPHHPLSSAGSLGVVNMWFTSLLRVSMLRVKPKFLAKMLVCVFVQFYDA